jgi:NAD(P)-dependent dehydrogenase (short-subunit alcohol dehydrogenase family)
VTALVVVTGGSAGLGRALLTDADEDATRIDVSRSGSGDEAIDHLAADLADPASWPRVGDALAARIAAHEGDRITVIHSAGTLVPIGFAGEVDTEAYTRQVLLNAAAPQVLGHRVLAALHRHPASRRELVLLSSGAARTAYPGWSAYGAGKAAVDQWVRAVVEERAQRDGVEAGAPAPVRVLAVAPGVVATGMQAAIRATAATDFPAVERFRSLHDGGGLADADDVARRLWTLLDDAAADPHLGPVVDLRSR